MLYLGHFSFSFESTPRRRKPQAWHGYFSAVAEAPSATIALQRLESLIRKTAESSDLFNDVADVYLESCIELRSTPRAGLVAHLALQEGESVGSISTTLPGVSRAHARSYHYEPDAVDADGAFEAEPFIELKSKAPAKRAASKSTPSTQSTTPPSKVATRSTVSTKSTPAKSEASAKGKSPATSKALVKSKASVKSKAASSGKKTSFATAKKR